MTVTSISCTSPIAWQNRDHVAFHKNFSPQNLVRHCELVSLHPPYLWQGISLAVACLDPLISNLQLLVNGIIIGRHIIIGSLRLNAKLKSLSKIRFIAIQ